MASLVSVMNSWSLPSRRYFTRQANVRSTTHRCGWIRNPSGVVCVVVTLHPHTRRTQRRTAS